MTFDPAPVAAVLQAAVPGRVPAAQLVVLWRGAPVLDRSYGWLDPETRRPATTADTLFDLASLTKLFVATTFMTLVEAGATDLDAPVATVLTEWSGRRPIQPYEDPLAPGQVVTVAAGPPVDLASITFRHLLTHTSGLPAWRPLFRCASTAEMRRMALETAFAYPTGSHVVYSDIGLILLGLAVERLSGLPLAAAVEQRVTRPLGLAHTGYLPGGEQSTSGIAPTEVCSWRGRRARGEVHDENAAALGGVAGHAGLFSNAGDVARFGRLFLDGGRPLLRSATVAEMTRLQAEDDDTRRGLAFALWSPDPEASGHPFSRAAFGHTGFTGTSLWIDPERELVVSLLTNEVYNGRQARTIGPLRVAVHRAIVEAVDEATKR